MVELKKHYLTLAGITFGGLLGFLCWKNVGCISGTCPITSSATNSSLYGAVMGVLFLSLFKRETKT